MVLNFLRKLDTFVRSIGRTAENELGQGKRNEKVYEMHGGGILQC